MAQTYTLDEAADKLNLSVEEFKRRLRTEWTQVRSFRDGSTLRFRSNEIDELARTFGLGSSDELQLTSDSDSFVQPKPAGSGDSSAKLDTDEIFLISPEGSSAKLRGQDSDIRLEKSRSKPAKSTVEDDESIMSEELQSPSAGGSGKLTGRSGKLSSSQLKSGDSGKLKSGDSGKSKKKSEEDDSSEFELSLDVDSDEFTLAPDADSSEEVALGDLPTPSPSAKSGQSGINLNRPADSGVSLERHSDESEDIDFELSLDAPGSGKSSKKSSGKLSQPDSDSEFELTLEEPSDFSLELTNDAPAADEKKNDIFEATDFEIPALEDESSEAVALDESDTDLESSSDFDLALDDSAEESGSEVVALDDEDEPAPKSKKNQNKKKSRSDDDDDDGGVDFDDEMEDDASASMALKGAAKRRFANDDDDDLEVSVASDDDDDVRTPANSDWGKLPIALLVPTMIFLFLGGIMAYEVVHSVWGYQQGSKPTTPIVSGLADLFGMAPSTK